MLGARFVVGFLVMVLLGLLGLGIWPLSESESASPKSADTLKHATNESKTEPDAPAASLAPVASKDAERVDASKKGQPHLALAPQAEFVASTPRELSAFLASCQAKFGFPQLFSAVDHVYKGEERDENWAGAIEHELQAIAPELGVSKLQGDCRTSVCRFELDYLDGDARARRGQLCERISADLGDPESAITCRSANGVVGAQGVVEVFFRSSPSKAAYVRSLQKELGDCFEHQ